MGLVPGCGRPSTPPAKTSGTSSGLVRPGQTGEFVSFEVNRPLRPEEPRPPLLFPQVYLNEFGASHYGRRVVHHTPIVVTENPADEEFWEFTYRRPAFATGGVAEDFDRVLLI